MIQLDKKNKIFVLLIIILIIVILFFILSRKKTKDVSDLPVNQKADNFSAKVLPTRDMTDDEKINKVGIDPAQDVEVLNEENGLYIYRLKN